MVALAMMAAPAAAGEWRDYKNTYVGYAIDLPVSLGQASETQEGVVIDSPTVTLTVFGLDIYPMDFATAAERAAASSADEGYAVTGRTILPDRARYGAAQGARRLAVGLVELCGGGALAGFELRYMEADTVAMAPVIARLDRSLRNNREC
jgi:hypothetical protein